MAAKLTTQAQPSDYGVLSYNQVKNFSKLPFTEQESSFNEFLCHCRKRGIELSSFGNEHHYVTIPEKRRIIEENKKSLGILPLIEPIFNHERSVKFNTEEVTEPIQTFGGIQLKISTPDLEDRYPKLHEDRLIKFTRKVYEFVVYGNFQSTNSPDEPLITSEMKEECLCRYKNFFKYKKINSEFAEKTPLRTEEPQKLDLKLVVKLYQSVQQHLKEKKIFHEEGKGCSLLSMKNFLLPEEDECKDASEESDNMKHTGEVIAALALNGGIRLDFRILPDRDKDKKFGVVADPRIKDHKVPYVGLGQDCFITDTSFCEIESPSKTGQGIMNP